MTSDPRPGYYVDGRRYALTYPAQAQARARRLSAEYQRPVPVYTRAVHAGALVLDAPLSTFWRGGTGAAMTDSIDSPQEIPT